MITTNSQSKSKFYWKSSKAKEVLKIVLHLIKRRFETFYKSKAKPVKLSNIKMKIILLLRNKISGMKLSNWKNENKLTVKN